MASETDEKNNDNNQLVSNVFSWSKRRNNKVKKLKQVKGKWYNDNGILKEYKSIDPDAIPSLNLTDLNDNKFIAQYKYPNCSSSCHWLIPGILLVGEVCVFAMFSVCFFLYYLLIGSNGLC